MIRAVFYFDDNSVTIHSENTKLVQKKFNPGYYRTSVNGNGGLDINCIEFKEIHEPFPNQRIGCVIDSLNKFLEGKNRRTCNEMGYVYKMNYLLYGKQGVGKTALINYLSDGLLKRYNAIVFRVDMPSFLEVTWSLAEQIRRIQDNPIVFIIDEFEMHCKEKGEAYLKNMLDGNRSINNTVIFAATNYLDRIPETIKNRPSRFRIVTEVKSIDDTDVIRSLIKKIHDKASTGFLTEDQMEGLVKSLKGTTIDELKTRVIDVLMDITFDLPSKEKIGFSPKGRKQLEMEFDDALESFAVPKAYGYVATKSAEPLEENGLFNHQGENVI